MDEAYFEFHGETISRLGQTAANLFVARTFSKAYGLAGLRIGILVGDAATDGDGAPRRFALQRECGRACCVCRRRFEIRSTWNSYVAEVQRGRERLEQELGSLGSALLAEPRQLRAVHVGAAHAEFVRALRARGILVRDRQSDPGCEGCVRLTVGSLEHTETLIAALREVVAQLRDQRRR